MMLYIIIGFYLQVVADSVYIYQFISGSYEVGGIVDLLYLVSLLFIGFGGLHSLKTLSEPTLVLRNFFEGKDNFFPYVSVLLLIILVIISYHWDFNALSLGLLVTFLMIIGRQIMIIKKNERLMKDFRYLAYHDQLTGLLNRASIKQELDHVLKMAKFNNKMAALFLIDLDRFKTINDTLGHVFGDKILIQSAQRLTSTLGDQTLIFRLGGDEFIFVLSDASNEQCSMVAENILDSFKNPFIIGEQEIMLTASIGISLYPENGNTGHDLIKNADAAMYLVKDNGKNGYEFYDSELQSINIRRLIIDNGLRKVIENEELKVFYQPRVELHSKKIIGMEALLRWNHPELGPIPPKEFIQIAEETGQIHSIGEWVLRKACEQNRLWHEKGFSHLCVSVNISVRQFENKDFLMMVRRILKETQLNPQFLELEITESITQNVQRSIEILSCLKSIGIKISIDDFGTGYSSLNILQKLPTDTLKIEKTFIDDIQNGNRQSMLKTIIDLGLNLNLNVLAEGIEHEHQVSFLLENKCNMGQGYLFSKAIPAEEFEKRFLTGDTRLIISN